MTSQNLMDSPVARGLADHVQPRRREEDKPGCDAACRAKGGRYRAPDRPCWLPLTR